MTLNHSLITDSEFTNQTEIEIYSELHGTDFIDIQSGLEPRKNIRTSRSFQPELTDVDDVVAALTVFTTRAMEETPLATLTDTNDYGICSTNPFNPTLQQYRNAVGFNSH